jgi:hypothetical protein
MLNNLIRDVWVLLSSFPKLRNKSIKDFTDNKTFILQSASNEEQLHETCLDFHNLSQL